jgi:23S rRNA (cytosine1962-C5)-methyltransferase
MLLSMKAEPIINKRSRGYELMDSGGGRKLERFGQIILDRPEPEALWQPLRPDAWKAANAVFDSSWKDAKRDMPLSWDVPFRSFSLVAARSPFRHVGIFPEHQENWKLIEDTIAGAGRPVRALNLFGYTGGATLAAAAGGAEVVHVDGSKPSVDWAKRNAVREFPEARIRYMVDDVPTFLRREARRGSVYDCIIMDPPASGKGPHGEDWDIRMLPDLVDLAASLLSPEPVLFLMNGYAAGYSSHTYGQILSGAFSLAKVSHGELLIEEAGSGRLLPAGISARAVW